MERWNTNRYGESIGIAYRDIFAIKYQIDAWNPYYIFISINSFLRPANLFKKDLQN